MMMMMTMMMMMMMVVVVVVVASLVSRVGAGRKQESTNGEYAERFGALDQESRARVDDLMR